MAGEELDVPVEVEVPAVEEAARCHPSRLRVTRRGRRRPATVPRMEDLEAIVDRIRAVLADEPVLFSYVFGSVARGGARDARDVDVAIRFAADVADHDRFEHALRIGVELERALEVEVDVVDLHDAPLRLAGRILTERVVVTGLEEAARVRYETDLLPRYLDFEYHARRLDDELLAAMAAGER